ncbi:MULTISPECIES: aromatic ring-hydroxylating dioxygenase subunit alpha [unclassified Beijerinckia]|uniref:aromatic ring-hydroxylating dioxygenase subunit alpha n=1 Tax=unclassified Beijerinckia TaxID=2638183 RepID=UPI000894DEBC|nr:MULTISPECIES: aromatic ring-hydroxylating dioxygenase subunit alpha [unclassified Beijerinckia]MDH7798265.1 phenylpropionate dioxygenase-like ring-hydroxylating dioxygenase large terminal subunit [Beijerinckia sp. GAS462]SED14960.1 vanillate O-demethylase monooxygenase subunit [Beijerinckia sp. 28-YEA-48]
MRVLRNCWYMFAWAKEFDAAPSITRVIADEPIVVALAAEGAGNGRSNAAGHRPIAVTVKHRIVWIWLGDAAEANVSAVPDFSCFDNVNDAGFHGGHLPTAAHYELLTDNILDLSHADFLHPDTLGGGAMTRSAPRLERDGSMISVTWDAPNDVALPIFDRRLPKPGQPAHVRLQVRWLPPAVMLLRAQVAPAGEPLENWFESNSAHIMTPESEFSTHYFYGAVRNYEQDNAEFTAKQAAVIRHAFTTEDKPMIEAQQRNMGTSDFWSLKPVLLSIDVGAVQARRALARLIEQSGQDATGHAQGN